MAGERAAAAGVSARRRGAVHRRRRRRRGGGGLEASSHLVDGVVESPSTSKSWVRSQNSLYPQKLTGLISLSTHPASI
jgi:hypothetical protein